MIKHCETCGLLDPKQNICPLLRTVVDPEEDFCSKHQDASSLKVCEICHRLIVGASVLTPDGDKWHLLCDECAEQLGTCAFCKNAVSCAFEDDPSPIPKLVQKQFRQGNMTTVTTVMNPERIRQTCEKGCHCFNPEFGCMRQFHYCKEMNHIYAEQS